MTEILRLIEQHDPPIKHAIFDLGGVVFSFTNGLESLAQKLSVPLDEIKAYWLSQDDAICRGKLDPQQFYLNLIAEFHCENEHFDFLPFWINHFVPIPSTHAAMTELASRDVKLSLLTNIYPGVFEKLEAVGAIPRLPFHKVILSCDLGMVKPEPAIFEYSANLIQSPANEVVFIDDRAENTRAAEQVGWTPILFEL